MDFYYSFFLELVLLLSFFYLERLLEIEFLRFFALVGADKV